MENVVGDVRALMPELRRELEALVRIPSVFALMVVFAKRYQSDAGIGTVIALMVPYALVVTVVWILFFILWFVIGIPLGPGAPVR